MNIAILSRNSKLYSTRRLREAAKARGHRVRTLDALRFAISLEEEYPDLYYTGRALPSYRAVIPRIGASITYFGTALVRQFEQMDVFCANSSAGITNSRDKLRALQILSRHNIGIPETEFVRRKEDVLPAIERVGGAPVIIKLLEGTQGVGVILAESLRVAQAIIETLQSTKQNVLIQKFVAESRGRDVRAFVVGDQVVAAMRRVAEGQEFRSNVHRGGRAEPVELDTAYEEAAIRAARIIGLRIAGVDMLETSAGPQVMEVNSSPGLEGIEKATGVDVARTIIEYVEDQVLFPDMDIRQRLALSKGYGVAEISVSRRSALRGKTIGESGLDDENVRVLTLHRQGRAIANPRGSRQLEVGDRLVCFGRLETMKSFLPKRRRRRPKRLRSATGERR
jgi:ribosomal protein S6--L-glutamate ligase